MGAGPRINLPYEFPLLTSSLSLPFPTAWHINTKFQTNRYWQKVSEKTLVSEFAYPWNYIFLTFQSFQNFLSSFLQVNHEFKVILRLKNKKTKSLNKNGQKIWTDRSSKKIHRRQMSTWKVAQIIAIKWIFVFPPNLYVET